MASCNHCLGPLPPTAWGGRPRRYCSDRCRKAAHRAGISGGRSPAAESLGELVAVLGRVRDAARVTPGRLGLAMARFDAEVTAALARHLPALVDEVPR